VRRTALALALSAAIAVPAVLATAPAFASGHPAETPHPSSKPVKVAFAAAGTITAVDTTAGTVTVAATGGTKDVRGKTVTVAVSSTTVIRVGSARKALADLAADYKVSVIGYHQGAAYTATRIDAKKVAAKTPSDDATPVPSGSESRGF
jgi:hypothetical protein